ncbi:MAG: glycosyltransferase family 2 protein [Anaerolineales bacterium]|nr:glycosyltransferase family 2 protein [Anaerolineales bacterium]
MYKSKKIAVVVPAHNEELLIGRVIETMPKYVDRIYIVDDASRDKTVSKVKSYLATGKHRLRLRLIELEENQGVGAAIVAGYRQASKDGMHVVAVMAGDAQMNPDELKAIIDPVVTGEVDYTKGNRLLYGNAWKMIPVYRFLGNSFLSLFTKFSSGYWHVADSQTGYTAISKEVIDLLPLEKLYRRYGYPNHILTMLNVYSCRVRDVPVQPIYNVGEVSEIRLWKVIPTISLLLLQSFLWRIWEKYILRDFHPLVFFYALGLLLFLASIALGIRLIWIWSLNGAIPSINALALLFTSITSFQAFFFAMWFDMDYNRHLR